MSRRPPRWTYRRLRFALGTAFGTVNGRPDTAAVARALGVSRRSAQRYLHGADGAVVTLPAGRLEQIQRAIRPDEATLRQEQKAHRYALAAIDRLQPGGPGPLAAWAQQRWLEPHLVAVLELKHLGLRQVRLMRQADRTLEELGKRGKVLGHVTVPTRFHASVLTDAVLQQVDPWRVQTPSGVVQQGRTHTWDAKAPRVRLPELAVTEQLLEAPSTK